MKKSTAEKINEAAQDQEQSQEQPEHLITAASTMLGDLMNCVINLAKALPKPWEQLSESQQERWLESVDWQCQEAVKECVNIISGRGMTVVPAVVESVTFKDGVKVVLKLMSRSEGAHAVADAEGEVVSITLADATELVSDNGKPKADPTQPGLELAESGD